MRPNSRYTRINRRTLAYRSPVDNLWRVWIKVPMAWFDDNHHARAYRPGTLAWVPMGVARKLKNALAQVKALAGGHYWLWATDEGGINGPPTAEATA